MFKSVIAELSSLPEVEAIALGGSRSGTHYDQASDYDIYLYCTGEISEATRRDILEKHSLRLEVGNHFWELEDNGTFRNGIDFDILYRNLDDFINDVAMVTEQFHTGNAYSTCMWHNMITCKILYDRNGRLTAAQKRFTIPYPAELRDNIVNRGWKLLHASMPAYELQINKAAKRGDWVSVNHRVSAFLETYFDILFARNSKTHPGEKRLIQLCKEQCPILPLKFEENLLSLFSNMFTNPADTAEILRAILNELAKIL